MPIELVGHWPGRNKAFVGVFELGRVAAIAAVGDFGNMKGKREPL